MIESEHVIDKMLRAVKCDPLCRCSKCGTRTQQLFDRAERQADRPIMQALWLILAFLVASVFLGLALDTMFPAVPAHGDIGVIG